MARHSLDFIVLKGGIRMKKIILVLIGLSLMFGIASADSLFEDGFESGNFNQWTTFDYPVITSDSTYVNTGIYAALFNGGPDPDDMIISMNIDTTGYSNIQLSYYRLIQSLEFDNSFTTEFSVDGGSSWNQIESINGDMAYTQLSTSLPSSAEDNPNLKVRFLINAGENLGDFAALDDVLITGDETNPPVISEIAENPEFPTCSNDLPYVLLLRTSQIL